jgi:hypothetical protein
VNLNLHLTDDTQLRPHGFVAGSGLFAEVQWDLRDPFPNSRSEGALWGTPEAMRRLAAAAIQAATEAEEEAAWQAHTRTTAVTTLPAEGAQVA